MEAQGTAPNPFDDREQDVAAVEDREGQEIEHGEVDVDEDGEPEREPPAVGAAQDHEEDVHDADRAAEAGRADRGMGGEERGDGVDDRADGIGDLFHRRGVNEFDGGVGPVDAEHRVLEALGFDGQRRHHAEVEGGSLAFDGEFKGILGVILDLLKDRHFGVELGSVEGDDFVAGLNARQGRWAGRDDFIHHEFLFRRADQDLAQGGALPEGGLVEVGRDIEGPGNAVARDGDDDFGPGAGDDAPDDGVAVAEEFGDRMAVDGLNFITGFDSGQVGGAARLDVADDGGLFRVGDGFADAPDDAGEKQREAKAEKRPGKRDDDLLPGRGGRQFLFGRLRLAFDGVRVGHLRQRDITACRYGAEDVVDAVDLPGPERLAEPDGEFIDLQAAPFGGEEMAQFVDDDEDVEERDDFEKGDNGKEKDAVGHPEKERYQNQHDESEKTP